MDHHRKPEGRCQGAAGFREPRRRGGRRRSRREFLRRLGAKAAALGAGLLSAPALLAGAGGLRIERIQVQEARGRRLTPVAPNAYAPYRGFEVREQLVRIRSSQGLEGVGHLGGKAEERRETLKQLLGLDPFSLFTWKSDRIEAPADRHRELVLALHGADVAVLDLLAKALRRPLASLLGQPCRERVAVYDSSLYMEDLLEPEEREGLAYLKGAAPSDPAEVVARKALWVLEQPGGIRILKIKIGRARWMGSPEAALVRDLDVLRAVRKAVGSGVALFVDGNDGYAARPLDALRFAEAAAPEKVHAMEEMFPEVKLAELREVKLGMRRAKVATKLADGENHRDGIPETILAERVESTGGPEPLFDINQPDMNQNGLIRMRELAARSARHGLTIAPHTFGSKMGFYPQVHLGMVTGNWEFSETDDSQFPGIEAPGIKVEKGQASLAGQPGLGIELREEKLERPSLVVEA